MIMELNRFGRPATSPSGLNPTFHGLRRLTISKLVQLRKYRAQNMKQASVGWHRDKPHFERILGLSLASACKFRFRRKNGAKWDRYSFDAEPRSLYRMMEEARHGWEHSIPPVEKLRYSITFRTMSR
jgi:hypothetical protein